MLSNSLTIFYLIVIEGILSLDNALALAALAKRRLKDPVQQKRALLYGVWGAYLFRIAAIFLGLNLIKYEWVKLAVGLYLIIFAIKELFFKKTQPLLTEENSPGRSVGARIFLQTILHIELLDFMFSLDSIAVALAVSQEKWVLITGASLGICLMRFASGFFISLINRFPILEKIAYILVGITGINSVLHINLGNLLKCLPTW